ncbi:FecR family protein [Pinibacter aurantiacus]|uniref:FecR domain-containing protein n=1 Tax=Pinibacter aurantiacus TaxID=2851599 RepID=A0A9E2WA06_9BACT|nr:FecR family protein [Pinibacter aurantiacus]MBV4360617.1 FecR domain-containing protein [Pinibacter aurantiacus]
MPDVRLQYLLEIYFKGTASNQETMELMRILEKEESNEELQSLLDSMWSRFAPTSEAWTEEKKEEQFDEVLQKIGLYPIPVKRMKTWHKVAAAAVVGSIVATTAFFYTTHRTTIQQPEIIAAKKTVNDIPPGKDRAFLTLQDGKKVDLDSLQKSNAGLYGFQKKNDHEIAFNNASSHTITYNTLATPKGGKYKLMLPDGSMVWLNAASTLRFPTAFQGDTRDVTLTGEAYFEIAQNAKQPFHVKVNDMDVQVLGTNFNVMAYDDESSINTTLLEGAVKVSQGNRSGILKPGQLSAVNSDGALKISEADIEETMAWKNDQFVFKSYDFKKIMRQLERWYNVTVVYKSKIPEGKYSGIIGRNNNISQVLNILKASGISFNINDNTIVVE